MEVFGEHDLRVRIYRNACYAAALPHRLVHPLEQTWPLLPRDSASGESDTWLSSRRLSRTVFIYSTPIGADFASETGEAYIVAPGLGLFQEVYLTLDCMVYRPNQIPRWERGLRIAGAFVLLFWGTFGVVKNDLLWPGRFNRNFHLQGLAAWLMYGAMICAALSLLTAVVDHYDRRDNERAYHQFSKKVSSVAWVLFGAALAAHLLLPYLNAI